MFHASWLLLPALIQFKLKQVYIINKIKPVNFWLRPQCFTLDTLMSASVMIVNH